MGVLDTAYTFASNDVITSTRMNDIIDQTTFTTDAVLDTTLAVSLGKLKVNTQGITSNELAANSVTTTAITDLSVTSEKLASSSVTADKFDASVGVARATLKIKTGIFQSSTNTYSGIPVTMSISAGPSPYTVSVASATPHGYLIGEPFFIWVSVSPLPNKLVCGFVDSIVNINSFTFKTTSSSIPVGSASIFFADPLKYNSRNIKRVHPMNPVLNSPFVTATAAGVASTTFGAFVQENIYFNATFNTPLSNVDNACTIGSDSSYTDSVMLNWFNFVSPPRRGIATNSGDLYYYNSSFSVAVFT